ncbi:Ig-like domain-containing protein [Leptothoe sp. PORK10 BA2]|uniref:Ig-like domain-containing protein n=1 Tax=Leptothoe sp. PORK10 BA2 TaxID=3110254 RepID=UPI002B202C04|nr:Ig-like domain-containing protein [Leptothoe sp. PORK10 BA2]MEA5463884.1 Ig-like domain-containing protein [Leptothoe sp. PORK10 BA2]
MIIRTATKTAVQEAAQQGDSPSIASILQTQLQTHGITPKVGLRQQDNLLYIALESAQPNDPKVLLPQLKAILVEMNLPWLNLVQVSNRLVGQTAPLWRRELVLQPTVDLELPMVSPPVVQVGISGDFSGQLIVGNNNRQNFYSYSYNVEHGGVLNVTNPVQIQSRPTPINLRPQPFSGLLDRKEIVPQLVQALQSAQSVELYAGDGFGKTALLSHLLYDAQATAHFRDGVVYTSAHRRLAADVLQELHNAFYQSSAPYKPSYTEVQHALQGKQALIVLEDLGLAKADLDWLLAIAPHSAFVLTSPEREYWGDGLAIELPGLPLDDSVTLIERELGRALTPAEQPVARTLWQALAGHPLQLRRAAAQAKRNQQSLTTLVLPQAASAHAGLQATPQATIFHKIVDTLPKPHHQVLALLGALAGLALTPGQAAAMAKTAHTEAILGELQALHVVGMGPNGYYLCPDLIGLCQQTWPIEPWLTSAVNYFTANPETAGQAIDTLQYLTDWTAQTDRWYDCLELSRALDGPLSLQGRWGQWQQVLEQSLHAAQQTGNQAAEAWSLHQLGTHALAEGNTTVAETALTEALRLRKALGDEAGAAITRHNLGLLIPPLVSPPEAGPVPSSWLTTKTALLATGAVAIATAALLVPRLLPDPFTPPPSFTLSAEALAFGERERNTASAPQGLTISNTGNRPLPIDSLVLRGQRDFSVDEDSCTTDFFLAPGETCEITIIFTPEDIGQRSASMELTINGKTYGIDLTGSGAATAVPSISIVPASIVFNAVQLDKTEGTTLTIANDGTAPLRIQTLAIVGDQASDFAIANTTCAETTLAPQDNCTVELTFSPSSPGERVATLTVQHNANPQTAISLSGVGTEQPPPPRPTATDDSVATPRNQAVTIKVLENDSDPAGGRLAIVSVTPAEAGKVQVNDDHTLTYRPDGEATTDRFTYRIRNEQNQTAEATVTVTIQSVQPPAPVATPDRAETEAGQPVIIGVLNNDSGEGLTVATVDSSTSLGGTIVNNDDGTVTYRPSPTFSGVDRFNYTNRDRNGIASEPATVQVQVNPAPPPMAKDDTAFTEQNRPVTIDILANDAGEGLTITDLTGQTAAGGLAQIGDNEGVVYTPPEGFDGEDRFSYAVRDRYGTISERAIVTIQVNPNRPPIANDDSSQYIYEGKPVNVRVEVLNNDDDPDGDNNNLTVASVTSGEFIQASISDDGRAIIYTPVPIPQENQSVFDRLTYTIRDAGGAVSEPATVSIEGTYRATLSLSYPFLSYPFLSYPL